MCWRKAWNYNDYMQMFEIGYVTRLLAFELSREMQYIILIWISFTAWSLFSASRKINVGGVKFVRLKSGAYFEGTYFF